MTEQQDDGATSLGDERRTSLAIKGRLKIPMEIPPQPEGTDCGDNGYRSEEVGIKAVRLSLGTTCLFIDADGWSGNIAMDREEAARLGWVLIRMHEARV